MARPPKKGLDYFNVDCYFDNSLQYIESKHGLESIGILLKLWQSIYSDEGYYLSFDIDDEELFCAKYRVDENEFKLILKSFFKKGIFNEQMYKEHSILTSQGLQKRYQNICKAAKRKGIFIEEKYRLPKLITDELEAENDDKPQKPVVSSEETVVSSEETQVNDGDNRQRKGKESKEKENTVFINDENPKNSNPSPNNTNTPKNPNNEQGLGGGGAQNLIHFEMPDDEKERKALFFEIEMYLNLAKKQKDTEAVKHYGAQMGRYKAHVKRLHKTSVFYDETTTAFQFLFGNQIFIQRSSRDLRIDEKKFVSKKYTQPFKDKHASVTGYWKSQTDFQNHYRNFVNLQQKLQNK